MNKKKNQSQDCRRILCIVNRSIKTKGKIGNSYAYLNSYNTLRNFNKGKKLNYTFSHIDVAFCRKFEDWMRSKGNKDTTLSYQFRTLRATFNKAIEAKIVARDKIHSLNIN